MVFGDVLSKELKYFIVSKVPPQLSSMGSAGKAVENCTNKLNSIDFRRDFKQHIKHRRTNAGP